MNMNNWRLIASPLVLKKTGTVVKRVENRANPNITKKMVNVGPHNNRSKISRSSLTFENKKPQKLRLENLNYGVRFVELFKKVQKGWQKVTSFQG